jgi:hypothetical protein
MTKQKYANILVHEHGKFPLELAGKTNKAGKNIIPGVKATHVLTVDETSQKGFFSVDCTWLWSGAAKEPVGVPHKHDFDHIIGIAGGNAKDPQDLGGEITVWLDGRPEKIVRNTLIVVPAGVVHGPYLFTKIERPVFFVSIANKGTFSRTVVNQVAKPERERKYSIVDYLKKKDFTVAATNEKAPAPPPGKSDGCRILHVEDDIVKGAFYVDFVWVFKGTGGAPVGEHDHEWPELLAMLGADPDNPYDNGGEMYITLGNETYSSHKSTLVCIPEKTKHCPWGFRDIVKPSLIFSAGPSGMYTGSHKTEAEKKF